MHILNEHNSSPPVRDGPALDIRASCTFNIGTFGFTSVVLREIKPITKFIYSFPLCNSSLHPPALPNTADSIKQLLLLLPLLRFSTSLSLLPPIASHHFSDFIKIFSIEINFSHTHTWQQVSPPKINDHSLKGYTGDTKSSEIILISSFSILPPCPCPCP